LSAQLTNLCADWKDRAQYLSQ